MNYFNNRFIAETKSPVNDNCHISENSDLNGYN